MRKWMSWVLVLTIGLALVSACALADSKQKQRRQGRDVEFSEWKFRRDPACRGLSEGWYSVEFDATEWGPIKVPAPWPDTWIGGYLGYGWYRTTFDSPVLADGVSLKLEFSAVDEQAWVFVNGRMVGEHSVASEGRTIGDLWNTPFTIDVPGKYLMSGKQNVLSVLVHSSSGSAGIWLPLTGTFEVQ